MAALITEIDAGSLAERVGLRRGETLLRIGEHSIRDVLDYQFYMTDDQLLLEVADKNGKKRCIHIEKDPYEDLGLSFQTYLMDKKRGCRNHCVFCFIDQLPKGLRDTLYFKDDDARLSFLMGNYITLTNVSDEDIDRIINMHISPVNVSVHTTNPILRAKMMRNPHAGESLPLLYRLAKAGTQLNCQLVLCPGLNDGEELRKTLTDLEKLYPSVQSISAVPVGITRYRDGLYPMRTFTAEEAASVVQIIESFGTQFLKRNGTRLAFASDEFYIRMGKSFHAPSFYEDFPQLENGVGMVSLLTSQFQDALDNCEKATLSKARRVMIATGIAAKPFLKQMARVATKTIHGLFCHVQAIENNFFGGEITVAGLITGKDLIEQTRQAIENLNIDVLCIPSSMLRSEGDLFLDNVSLEDVKNALKIPILPVENDGESLLSALIGDFNE